MKEGRERREADGSDRFDSALIASPFIAGSIFPRIRFEAAFKCRINISHSKKRFPSYFSPLKSFFPVPFSS